MIKILKYFAWMLTKKYKILRGPYFFLIALKNKFNPVGWWIPSESNLSNYFSSIADCDYVVFSSLKQLSDIEFNRDIDILFRYEQLTHITRKLKRGRPSPNAIRVDLYSLEGIHPYTNKGIAYFPPKLGRAFLEKATFRSGVRVLCDQHQALSNLYREVYIKGMCNDEQFGKSSKIFSSFRILEISINNHNLTFKYIDEYFAKLGFRPPLDTIKILSEDSDCLRTLIENEFSKFESSTNVLTIFIRSSDITDDIIKFVNSFPPLNYKIFSQGSLSRNQISLIKDETRGGNWYSDSFNVAGDPVYWFTFIDETTMFDLEKVKLYKTYLRENFHQNIIHSADSSRESIYYFSLIHPHEWKKLIYH
jgi:hypothetical protein